MIQFDRYKDGKRYALTFSYDDAGAADRHLVELFAKFGMKATFNLISGSITSPETHGIRADEVRSLYIENGHEVACHTFSHPHLERMSIQDQYGEIMRDRELLEKASGTIVRGLAYPFGTYNRETFTAMDTASVVYGRTAGASGNFLLPDNFKVWVPTTHHNECEPMVKRFLYNVEKAPWRAGGVLYIWGHSYEFDNPELPVGWEKFEELLTALHSGAHDIWYATNIEIYDYVHAVKRIRRSADGKTFYNPTDIDIWFSQDDRTLCIGAGKTVVLE